MAQFNVRAEIRNCQKRIREIAELERVERSRLNNANILRQLATMKSAATERLESLRDLE